MRSYNSRRNRGDEFRNRRTPKLCTKSVPVYHEMLDVITKEFQEDTPRAMLLADDLVICDEIRERKEERLENWRGCLEDAGLKVSRLKTEHLPLAGNQQKINMKEYDSDGKSTAGVSIQIFGNYNRQRRRMWNRSGKGG